MRKVAREILENPEVTNVKITKDASKICWKNVLSFSNQWRALKLGSNGCLGTSWEEMY